MAGTPSRSPGRSAAGSTASPAAPGCAVTIFEPHGLSGHLYWKSVAPFRSVVFGGMARTVTGTAERQAGT